jgi:hypothetical protein
MIEVHNYSLEMGILEGKDVMSTLLDGLSFFKGREYWLSAGTLLGLERDGDFIPYDTDIDIAVRGAQRLSLSKDYTLMRTVYDGRRPMQTAYMHQPSQIPFDIFHYYDDGEEIYNSNEAGSIRRVKSSVIPLQSKEYRGEMFTVPNDIDAYLTQWYGDWRTPVRGGKTEWK